MLIAAPLGSMIPLGRASRLLLDGSYWKRVTKI